MVFSPRPLKSPRPEAQVPQRAGLRASDLDVIESNEAFAAQACAVKHELDLDPAKVNPNGSAISLGHPIGATGTIITSSNSGISFRTPNVPRDN